MATETVGPAQARVSDDHALNLRLGLRAQATILSPGYARRWPHCAAAMEAIAEHILALGGTDEEAARALAVDFPDPLPDPGRSAAARAMVVGRQQIRRERHPLCRQEPDWDLWEPDEPDEYAMQVVGCAADALAMLEHCAIRASVAADGGLRLSRPIRTGGPLYRAVARYKAGLIKILAGDRL